MTMQNPIDILRQFSPTARELTSQYAAGQNITANRLSNQQQQAMNPLLLEQQQLANQTGQFNLDQARQGVTANEEALRSQANVKNTASNLVRLNTAIEQGATPEQLGGMLQQNIQNAQANGGFSGDSTEALQVLQTQGIDGLRNLAGQATAVFEQQGILKPKAKAGIDFAKINPEKFTQDSLRKAEQSGRYSDLIPMGGSADEPVFLGELRKELRTDVGKLEADAAKLETNFGKLKNLAGEVKKGNRTAVAQALVSLVKLGDPGSVVKEEELRQALGAQNPLAATIDVLRGEGSEVDSGVLNSVLQKFDPLNPTAVNIEDVLSTAQAMLKPNAEALSGAYNDAKTRSGQLSEDGRKSIFSENRDSKFGRISELSFGVTPPAALPSEQPAAAQPEVVQTFIGPDGQPQDFRINAAGEWEPIQ